MFSPSSINMYKYIITSVISPAVSLDASPRLLRHPLALSALLTLSLRLLLSSLRLLLSSLRLLLFSLHLLSTVFSLLLFLTSVAHALLSSHQPLILLYFDLKFRALLKTYSSSSPYSDRWYKLPHIFSEIQDHDSAV